MSAAPETDAAHIPVLLDPILDLIAPVSGIWLDGTFGAGGYARALLDAGAMRVIGVDRDPDVLKAAAGWAAGYGDRLTLCAGRFGDMDKIAQANGAPQLDGIVLDIGVSSMQIDQAERGFSFAKDGPLDMRMEQAGPSAADLVNGASEALLADILYQYGEERASRRIARKLVEARKSGRIERTRELARLVESCLPRPRPGQPHAATRTFQALRIAVNDELGELARGLMAAEALLRQGGLLVVVTFHSLEDRMVKRFIQEHSDEKPRGSRFQPGETAVSPAFARVNRKAVTADARELARNPRARSAKLRVARRLSGPVQPVDLRLIGLPDLTSGREGWT